MKWGVVLAGASDFLRPADKLSLTQNMALMATGSIWTRWCFVIRPKNMLYTPLFLYPYVSVLINCSLALVNFCLFIVGTVQVGRILSYQATQKGSLEAAVKDLAGDVTATAKGTEQEAVKDAKKIKQEL